MNGRRDQEDDNDSQDADRQLLTQLRQAIELRDPPPADLASRAQRAFSWDAALEVLLQEEGSTEEAAPALRRNVEPQRRDLSYHLPSISLKLSIDETGDGSYRLTGTVSPAGAIVELVEPNGESQAVDVDRKGRFTVSTWSRAAALQLMTAEGLQVRTPVIDLDG